jgi:nicotinate-nucleotide adenylyltransferase
VLGGSFNPIHLGHLLLADEIQERLGLDQVLFVPASLPPHKPSGGLAAPEHRDAMVRLAIAGHPRFAVSDLELRRPGPSYTVDTLEEIRLGTDPTTEIFLLLGSETFLDLLAWKEPARLAQLARLVVIPRVGASFDPKGREARKILQEIGQEQWVPVPDAGGIPALPPKGVLLAPVLSLPISASELRRRVREGRSIAYRVPPAVEAYILAHGLYREDG